MVLKIVKINFGRFLSKFYENYNNSSRKFSVTFEEILKKLKIKNIKYLGNFEKILENFGESFKTIIVKRLK